MEISFVLDSICCVIVVMTIYFCAGRQPGKERRLNLACMLTSLAYCLFKLIQHAWHYVMMPDLLKYNEIICNFILGLLFIFYFHYILCVTRHKLDRKLIALWMCLFAVAEVFVLTDDYHHLFYKRFEVTQDEGGYLTLHEEYGIGGYLFVSLLIFDAAIVLGIAIQYYRNMKTSNDKGKKLRSRTLLAVTFVPLLIAVLFFWDNLSNYDSPCIGMGLTGLLLTYALSKYKYMEVLQNAKEQVADNMNVGLLIFDENYSFLEANQFMWKHYPNMAEFSSYLDAREDFQEVVRGERNKLEWEDRVYSCYRSEVRSKSGVLDGYVITAYDITEIENYAREQESLKEKAEKANEQKTKFLANVTHEIRTPLNTILGMSEIALRKNATRDLEGPLKSIYREGKGVLEQIDTLLDVSRIESGEIRLSHEKYEMEELLYEISNMVYNRIDEKDLEYHVEVMPDFPKAFYGDRMRVKEIFQNLLGNAIQYTQYGKIVLNLDGEKGTDSRYKIKLSVKDTGVGMSKNDKENIFKRFKRSTNPKNEGVFGVGIGLDITMNLVQMMGGTIQVQSKLDEGSIFIATFYQDIADSDVLWIKDITRDQAINHIGELDFMSEIHVEFPGAHVLLVDDMMSNLKVEQSLMNLYSIEPEMALSGAEAIQKASNYKYDLIFMDHLMPEMDGVETLQNIRQIEKCKDIPIVAITANATVYTTDFYHENGFDGCLTKPLQTEDLLKVLKKYLSAKIRNKETEETEEELPIKELLPEIDCVVGIRNIGGNLESYNELLGVYYHEMAQILEILPDLAQEDLMQFKVKVHGIKGSSRNVGATEFADKALLMEERAKAGKKEEILENLDEFLKEMDAVITRVNTYLKDAGDGVKRDGDFLPELELTGVYKILTALEEFDMDVVEEEMKELYRNRYTDDTEEVLSELKRYVEDLDYKHAIEVLEEYLKRIG